MSARTPSPLALLALLAAAGACAGPREPLLLPEIGSRLRGVDRLDPEDAAVGKPVPLAEAPVEPAADTVDRARGIARDAPSPESVSLALADVRAAALANNLGLQVAFHDPAIAAESWNVERARFEAVLRASVRAAESRDAAGDPARSLALNPPDLAPALTVPLNTGGRVEIGLPLSVLDVEGAPDDAWSAALEFSVSQPLLRGAGPAFNEAPIRIAGLQSRQADARTKQAVIRVLANAERAYWNHYAAHLELRVQVEQYEAALRQLELARRLVAESVRTAVEVTRAESGVAQRFEAIVLAETTRRLAERALKRVVHRQDLPVDAPTVVLPATPAAPAGVVLDRPRLGALAITNRMELFENEVQLAIDRISVDVEDDLRLPSLALEFRYSFAGARSHLDSTIHQMFDRELNQGSASLALEVPLGNRAAKSRFQRAVLRHAQTRAARLDLEEAVRQDVEDAADTLEQDWQRILSARRDVLLATRTWQAEIQQFREGVVTSTEVLEAQARVAAAQSREIAAIRDYQVSRVDLSFATGTVLGISGVSWAPAVPH